MAHNVHGTFVSEKVNKIRWKLDNFNNSHFFVTGSWDNNENRVRLWDFQDSENSDVESYPFEVDNRYHGGDVTEMKFLNGDNFVTSSSLGDIHLYKIDYSESQGISLENPQSWKDIHRFKNGDVSPCTALAVYDNDIVSVGEDGKINLLTSKNENVIRVLDNADSCSINCVIFLKHNEILTSNLRGQMKIWDLRSQNQEPVNTFVLSGDMVSPTCLEFHPTQRHLIIAGDEEGSLTVWDLRHNMFPVNLMGGHKDSVTEIQFHPDYPDHFFSSSSDGEIWHWSTKSTKSAQTFEENDSDSNVWYGTDKFKNKVEVFTLMDAINKPVNSFSLSQNKVICGCDNEAIYLINGIKLYN